MLAEETDRRTTVIADGIEELSGSGEAESEKVEAMRMEAHGLKGAALVVGQSRLAELALRMEVHLTAQIAPGTVDSELAGKLIAAAGEDLHLTASAATSHLPPPADLAGHAQRLADVLSLADAFPKRRRAPYLDAPRMASR